ncbi:C39 family peptidase [Pseudactinotalea sp. Z1739]|uniref:C39 family peptidase n=1 Tax=Pseudactinotalea sp. Z1739 TaxID=3413028 RepID=UPI003C79E86D
MSSDHDANRISRRKWLGSVGAVGVAGAGALGAAALMRSRSEPPGLDDPAPEPAPRGVYMQAWEGIDGFDQGSHDGTAVDPDGRLVLTSPTGTVEYTDPHTEVARTYDTATWTSPEVQLPFAGTEVIPSWNARTPSGTWVEVAVQGITDSGEHTDWYVLARWSRGDDDPDIQRGTVEGQRDTRAGVEVDVLAMRHNHTLTGLRVRATLHRIAGATQTPEVALLTAMVSAIPDERAVPVSEPGEAAGIVLDVPTYSQHLHKGHYPEWNGGGQAWCSPTCTAMVLDHFGLGPDAEETGWVDIEAEQRPQVDHVTRYVFDYTYGGAGNWAFNAAYAGERGARAYITRLRSLREAEEFISAGIPLICSMSFTEADLDGAGYGTNGHLLTIVGFDADGDVVVNDPASQDEADDGKVRVTYPRDQFESLWLTTSGGLVYVIAPPGHALPEPVDAAEPNWV